MQTGRPHRLAEEVDFVEVVHHQKTIGQSIAHVQSPLF